MASAGDPRPTTVVTGISSPTRARAAAIVRSAASSASSWVGIIPMYGPARYRHDPRDATLMSVRRDRWARARSRASSSARAACVESSIATRMFRNTAWSASSPPRRRRPAAAVQDVRTADVLERDAPGVHEPRERPDEQDQPRRDGVELVEDRRPDHGVGLGVEEDD